MKDRKPAEKAEAAENFKLARREDIEEYRHQQNSTAENKPALIKLAEFGYEFMGVHGIASGKLQVCAGTLVIDIYYNAIYLQMQCHRLAMLAVL